MKKLALILFVLLFLQSCDTFRRMAGRPVSAEIQAKRERIAADEEAERIRQAELEAGRRMVADSLNALNEIQQAGIEVRGAGNLKDDAGLLPGSRYYIIIGAYRSKVNVEKLMNLVRVCGFTAVPVCMNNGNTCVGVNPTNSIAECLNRYKELRELPFCPEDAWILDVER